jgi:hypothetical protein
MAQTIIPLTDDELMAVADDPEAAKLFTSEERRRLSRLRPTAKPPDLAGQMVEAGVNALPMVGGTIGGVIGGMAGVGAGSVPMAVGGATVGGALGETAKQGINALRGKAPSETPVRDVALGGAEQGAYEALGGGITKAAGSVGKAVYRGYLKPSLAQHSIGKADQIVQTALDEALPITQSGVDKANRVIRDLRATVDAKIAAAPGTIDLHQIAEHIRGYARQRYYKPGKPSADFEAALKVADDLDRHPTIANPFAPNSPAPVTPSRANEIKRGIDESIGDANFGVERGATKTTQKAARRELRTAIEGVVPDVGPLNAREGRLIDAAKSIARAVGRESNKSPLIGVNTLTSGAIGGAVGGPGGVAAALVMRMGLTPEVATRAAIVAHRLGKMSGSTPAAVARAAVQAVSELEQRADSEGPQQ